MPTPMADAPIPKATVRGDLSPRIDATPADPPPGATAVPLYALFSIRQVVVATIVAGPIAGCWLLARNFRRLRRPVAGWLGVAFGVALTIGSVWLAVYVPSARYLSFGALAAILGLARATQNDDLDSHRSRGGPTASWGAAVVHSVASLAVTVALVVVGAIGYEWLATPPKVEVGPGEIYYADGATEAEARAVGEYLMKVGYLGHEASVKLYRERDRVVAAFVVQDSAFADVEVHAWFLDLSDELSTTALSGSPVDIVLADEYLTPKLRLAWETRTRRVAVGSGEVWFRDVTESEAREVGRLLAEHGALDGRVTVTRTDTRANSALAEALGARSTENVPGGGGGFRVWRGGHPGRIVVEFSEATRDVRSSHRFASPISTRVFAGAPVDIRVVDGSETKHELAWESRPSDPIAIGHHRVNYRNGVLDSEARAVAAVLQPLLATLDEPTEVGVLRDGDGKPLVEFAADAFEAPAAKLALHRYAEAVSIRAFAGAPLDFVLIDGDDAVVVRLAWEMRPANKPAAKR